MKSIFTDQMLKKKIASALEDKLFFNQPCLRPEDSKCNPDEYFKEISYLVDLESNISLIITPIRTLQSSRHLLLQ
jgi:hypothetical protein